MQSNFTILSNLGNYRFSLQCNKCGHSFTHRAGSENSVALSDGTPSPLCPVCKAQDELQQATAVASMTKVSALAVFGIVVQQTPPGGKAREPWEVYDFSMRQSHHKTEEECVERGMVWLEGDITGNEYGDGMEPQQEAALKVLFGDEKAAKLLALGRPNKWE